MQKHGDKLETMNRKAVTQLVRSMLGETESKPEEKVFIADCQPKNKSGFKFSRNYFRQVEDKVQMWSLKLRAMKNRSNSLKKAGLIKMLQELQMIVQFHLGQLCDEEPIGVVVPLDYGRNFCDISEAEKDGHIPTRH
jgi:hypothetical protein